jgi:hypothetical protein
MSIGNLGRTHITAAQITAIDTALDAVQAAVTAITQNLSPEERIKFGSIDEKNKLLANGVSDWANTQPTLKSPDVDWTEFRADFEDRKFADTRMDRIATIARMLKDFKIVHDYDNYNDSLVDYKYSKYKAETNVPGFSEKVDYLKQFFSNPSGNNGSTPA